MPKLSDVRVSYRRSVQPRKYESAEASVELTMVFQEQETPDVDAVISEELARAQAHVETALNISGQTETVEPKPAAKPAAAKPAAAKADTKPKPAAKSAAAKPKPAGKPAAAKPKAKAAEAPASDAGGTEEPSFTKGDMMKVISQTLTALQKKGVTDGSEQIDKIVRGYLADDKPPYSYARIPEHSWGDFISDVEKLKGAA